MTSVLLLYRQDKEIVVVVVSEKGTSTKRVSRSYDLNQLKELL